MKKLIIILLCLSGCTTTSKPTITKDDVAKAAEIITEWKKAEAEKAKAEAEKNKGMAEAYTVTPAKPEDYDKVSALRWNESDECHIVQCYFGSGHDSELFKIAAELPIDFTCTISGAGVSITKPASDDTGGLKSYPGDHMQSRRAFICVFDKDGNLLDCEDWAESMSLDNRFIKPGVSQGLVIHCKHGKAVSRTELTEIPE